jgi:hypothetical protein
MPKYEPPPYISVGRPRPRSVWRCMEAEGTWSCGRRPGQPARSIYDGTRKKKASSSSWPPSNRHLYPFHASWPSLGEEIKPPWRCDLSRGTAQVPSHLPSPDSTTSRRRRTGVVRRTTGGHGGFRRRSRATRIEQREVLLNWDCVEGLTSYLLTLNIKEAKDSMSNTMTCGAGSSCWTRCLGRARGRCVRPVKNYSAHFGKAIVGLGCHRFCPSNICLF